MHIRQLQDARFFTAWIHRFGTLKVGVLNRVNSILIVLFVGLISLHTSAVNADTQGRLLVMGDSLSAAYGMPQPQGWVALLQQTLNTESQAIQVHNASLSGETTSGGLQRLPPLLQQHQPQFVIIELGANDALRGQNLRVTQQNLARMIEMSQKQGAKVMLLGIRLPTNYGPAYDDQLSKMYQDLAAKYQLVFDPFFLEDIALEPDLMQQDGLHPNQQAQPLIVKRVWPLLQTLISK